MKRWLQLQQVMNIPLVHTQGGEVTGSIDESVNTQLQISYITFQPQKSKDLLKWERI